MRSLSLLLVLAIASVAWAQAPTSDVPATAKVTMGMSTPIAIKLPAGTSKFSMAVNPPEGVAVWREFDADPLTIKLRVELVPGKDGKPQASKYYLACAIDGKISTCIITVDNATPDPAEPSPVDELVKQVKELAGIVAAIDKRAAAQEARLDRLEKTPAVTVKPQAAKAASIVFVVLDPTAQTGAVLEDRPFREWLKTTGLQIYGITTKAQLDSNPRYAGLQPPCIVLQDAQQNVILSAPFTDAAAAKAFINQNLGK